jgi:hypothetical protein
VNGLKKPIKIPIGITANRDKVLDLQHFFRYSLLVLGEKWALKRLTYHF